MLRQDDFLKSQLVLFAWRHGKPFGGHLASEAIMNVIANRVKLGWGTWIDVLAEAPLKCAVLEQPADIPHVWSPEFTRLLHIVDGVFDSSTKDLSNGALYWFDSSKPVTNEWFKEKIVGELAIHKKCADMNSLLFLR